MNPRGRSYNNLEEDSSGSSNMMDKDVEFSPEISQDFLNPLQNNPKRGG